MEMGNKSVVAEMEGVVSVTTTGNPRESFPGAVAVLCLDYRDGYMGMELHVAIQTYTHMSECM